MLVDYNRMIVYFRAMRTKDENKKQAIYRAAMELVNSNGLAGTSMSKIARAAGVSASTLYVYFENKEEMLNVLYLMAKEESSTAIFDGFDQEADVEQALRIYLRKHFHFMQENPVVFSFFQQFYSSPTISAEVREEGLRYYQPLLDVYARGVAEGRVQEAPLSLVHAFSLGPIESLVQAHRIGELVVDDVMLERAIDMVWSTIKV